MPINFSSIIPVSNIVQSIARYGMSVHLPNHTVSKTRIQQYEYSPSKKYKILKLRMIERKITCKSPQNSQYTKEAKVKVPQYLIKH